MSFKYEPVIYYDEPDRKVVDLRAEGVPFIPLASRTLCRYTRDSPGLHVHKGLGEIVYCVRGALSFDTPEKIWPFLPGDVFVSGPDEPHTMRINLKGAFVYRLIVAWPGKGRALPGLTADETSAIVKTLGNGSRRLFVGGPSIKPAFERLFSLYEDRSGDGAVRGMRLRACALEILLACADAATRAQERFVPRTVQKWVERMANEPDGDFDIDEMANDAKLTPQRFRSMFKNSTGLPVHAYLMLCRIEGAKEMVRRRPNMSLLAVSQRFRFSSAPHFAASFKRIAGKTFTEYVKSLAMEQDGVRSVRRVFQNDKRDQRSRQMKKLVVMIGAVLAAWSAVAANAALPPLAGDGVVDDTLAIQARLDSGACCVYLPPPAKCYLISKTLKIGSNQELRLDRFSVIRLAPNSNCPMIENRGYVGGADKRIAITGGIWDMANTDQSPNPQQYGKLNPPRPSPMPPRHENGFFFGMAMRFSNVEGMTVRGVTVRNPTSYGIAFCKTSYFLVDDVTFDYTTWNPIPLNLDGVHFDGHCHHGKISNLRGTCFDDLVALNANDGQCAQEEGAITDIDIDGVYADYCHSAVRMLSTGAELKRVTVRNVHGNFYTYAVGLTHFFAGRPRGCFDDIVISDVFSSKVFSPEGIGINSRTNYPPILVQGPVDVGSLTIRNLSRDERNIPVATIRVDKDAVVRRLTVRDCKMNNCMDRPIQFFAINGKVEKLTAENNDFSGKWTNLPSEHGTTKER